MMLLAFYLCFEMKNESTASWHGCNINKNKLPQTQTVKCLLFGVGIMLRQDLKYSTLKVWHFLIRDELMDAIKTQQIKNHYERSFRREECENSLDLDMRNNGNKSASKKQSKKCVFLLLVLVN